MAEKNILISLDDEKQIKRVSEALSNKTCKKIIDILSETEGDSGLSASDIAKKLNIGLNTIDYNLKKLIDTGLIEKTKEFFWSIRGKRISLYRVSNKKIIISPKKSIRSKIIKILPTVLISSVIGLGLKVFDSIKNKSLIVQKDFNVYDTGLLSEGNNIAVRGYSEEGVLMAKDSVMQVSDNGVDLITKILNLDIGIWFIIGAFFGLFIFLILNWKKLNDL